jgi:hypothetical protein
MFKMKRMLGAVGAGALLVSMMFGSTAAVLAADNTQYWAGNGTTNGEINNSDCDTDSSAHQLWIWTGTGTNVWISVDGEVVQGVQQGNGAYQFTTGWHDIGDLTTGDGGNVFVTYDGAADANAVLTLSHGCAGETTTTTTTEETTTTTTEETTTTTTEETTTTTTEETTTTTTTTFTGGTGGETDIPTEPNTATIGNAGPASPADGTWLLVLALGVLLGSVVVLTPAKARNRR